MAKWLALLMLDHKVLGLNPAGGGTAHVCGLHCTEAFFITLPSSQHGLTNFERYVKHQIIIGSNLGTGLHYLEMGAILYPFLDKISQNQIVRA